MKIKHYDKEYKIFCKYRFLNNNLYKNHKERVFVDLGATMKGIFIIKNVLFAEINEDIKTRQYFGQIISSKKTYWIYCDKIDGVYKIVGAEFQIIVDDKDKKDIWNHTKSFIDDYLINGKKY